VLLSAVAIVSFVTATKITDVMPAHYHMALPPFIKQFKESLHEIIRGQIKLTELAR
jgi:hypothetical protein